MTNDFLNTVAKRCLFSTRRREVFIYRFHPDNEALGNQELAEILYADGNTIDIGQCFQYHLNEICKDLEKIGFQMNSLCHKGRPRKGESPWEQAFAYLWETEFLNWRSQQNAAQLRTFPVSSSFNPQFYVDRTLEELKCHNALLEPGALIRIKGPQQIGKTWLIENLFEKLTSQNYRTANLSFKLADSHNHFTKLNQLLKWFCHNICLQLGLSNPVEDYWNETCLGNKVSCTCFFEEYLLKQTDAPLILCLDDVDYIFPYPEISEDFFSLLRSWHEKSKGGKSCWHKLRLVIIHSTEAYIRLNINQSPFNVGVPIELAEFDDQQVQELAKQYGFAWDISQVKDLMHIIGGYPLLVQQAFAHLKMHPDTTLDELLATASEETGLYGSHLRSHLLNLQQHPELATAFNTAVTETSSVRLEPMQAYRLHSMGLLKFQGDKVCPRCNLYRHYFRARIGAILGDAE